jgi:hypothetical protein
LTRQFLIEPVIPVCADNLHLAFHWSDQYEGPAVTPGTRQAPSYRSRKMEPTMPQHGAFPSGYSAADYGRDFRIFRAWGARPRRT